MLRPWPRAGAVPNTHRDLEGMQRGTKRAWRLWRLLPGRAACVGADVSTSPGDTSVSCEPPPPPPPASARPHQLTWAWSSAGSDCPHCTSRGVGTTARSLQSKSGGIVPEWGSQGYVRGVMWPRPAPRR